MIEIKENEIFYQGKKVGELEKSVTGKDYEEITFYLKTGRFNEGFDQGYQQGYRNASFLPVNT